MQPPAFDAPHLKPAQIWSIALGFLALVLVASGVESVVSYRKTIDSTSERTHTISHLIAEWLAGSFKLAEHVLIDVTRDIDPAEIRYPNPDPVRHQYLTNYLIHEAKTDSTIQFLGLLDAQCTITHTSIGSNLGRNFKERDYCRLAAQQPIEAFKVSPMFVSSAQTLNVTVSYPVLTPSRDMAGFALIGLDLRFFQQWLDRLQPTEGLTVSVFDAKQQLLARWPVAHHVPGQVMENPTLQRFLALPDPAPLTFRERDPTDRLDRVWTLQRVRNLPFAVMVGLPTQAALATWWAKFFFYYVLGNLTLAAVLLLGAREFNRNHQLARSMTEMAATDPLTGLANRRWFMQAADFRLEEARRYQQPLSILLIDIDHFKRINDHHGHNAGDTVLKAFAAKLQGIARSSDRAARWGGEEFIFLLPNTNQVTAARLAERVRALATEPAPLHGITVSIGVSEYQKGDTLEGLIKRADDALYRAKHQGRNQVQMAT